MLKHLSRFIMMSALLVLACERNSIPVFSQENQELNGVLSVVQGNVRDTVIDYSVEAEFLQLMKQPDALYRLSPNPRIAVAGEAILAITGWDWKVTKVISDAYGTWAVSDWAWVTDPNDGLGAYNKMKVWYGKNFSCWFREGDPVNIVKYWQSLGYSAKPVSVYNNVASYALYNQVGRGFQCPSFANAVLWRSGVYQSLLPSYGSSYTDFTTIRSYTKPFAKARMGDILRSKSSNGHTAVIVKILAGVEGSSVTSVDVVDANFVGGAGNEIIGRHIISVSGTGSGLGDLDNYYVMDLQLLGGQ